jgi:hypothetical protein
MKEENLAVVVAYIMHYDLLEEMNGSFFTKIDRAVEIGKDFLLTFSAEENNNWVDKDFEETLNEFVINKIKKL